MGGAKQKCRRLEDQMKSVFLIRRIIKALKVFLLSYLSCAQHEMKHVDCRIQIMKPDKSF